MEDLGNLLILVPPKNEMVLIRKFVADRTRTINALIEEAESAIVLLQERRSALISAAVTGKIDVRGLAPAEAEAA